MKNKPIKVFFGEKRLRDIYPHATGWQVFKFRVRRFFYRLFVVLGIIIILGITAVTARELAPVTVYADKEVIKEIEKESPVLARIGQCESGNKQFAPSGQVLIHINKNGTYDQGRYQINSIHNALATKLGFNLATEEGNTNFAKWMYANKGTGDWESSRHCWSK